MASHSDFDRPVGGGNPFGKRYIARADQRALAPRGRSARNQFAIGTHASPLYRQQSAAQAARTQKRIPPRSAPGAMNSRADLEDAFNKILDGNFIERKSGIEKYWAHNAKFWHPLFHSDTRHDAWGGRPQA